MNGTIPWKSDIAKLLVKKLNQALLVGEVVLVGDHIEVILDNITYKLTITVKRG